MRFSFYYCYYHKPVRRYIFHVRYTLSTTDRYYNNIGGGVFVCGGGAARRPGRGGVVVCPGKAKGGREKEKCVQLNKTQTGILSVFF